MSAATAQRVELISRELTLPAHIWRFIEAEAATKYQGDVALVVGEMYHEARTYRAMVEPAPRKRRAA